MQRPKRQQLIPNNPLYIQDGGREQRAADTAPPAAARGIKEELGKAFDMLFTALGTSSSSLNLIYLCVL